MQLLEKIREQQKIKATYTQEEIEDLDKLIANAEDLNREDFKVYMKADMAGMLNDYRITYPLLSQSVHTSIHSIETDLIFDDYGDEIIGINAIVQKIGDMSLLLMTSANYISIGIEMLLIAFPNDESNDELKHLKENVQKAWEKVIVAVQHR